MNHTTIQKHVHNSVVSETGRTISRGHYAVCSVCHNVRYIKQWYAPDSKVALLAGGDKAHTEALRCPACEMKRRGEYVAVVKIHDVPKNLRSNIETIIINEGRNATCHNPQNRVLEILETLDGYEVRTTSAKVARAIGNAIQGTFTVTMLSSSHKLHAMHHNQIDIAFAISECLQ